MNCSRSVFHRAVICVGFSCVAALLASSTIAQRRQAQQQPPQPPAENTFMPVVPTKTFEEILEQDTAEKEQVAGAQKSLFESRYDLRNNPSNVQMSGGRRAVQQGVRVKLHGGASWDNLAP